MKLKKQMVIILLTGLLLSFFSLYAAAQPTPDNPLNLEVGHILSPETVQNDALEMFKELVEEGTDGAILIDIFPAEQLGTAPDQLENVSMGAQSMMLLAPNWLQIYSERLRLTEVPFLYDGTMEQLDKWYDEVLEELILPELVENGNIRMINAGHRWIRAPYMVLVSSKPVMSLEDLEGLNLRLWPSDTVQGTWGRMGPDISIIDYAEVYLALQYGTIDALPTPINLVYPQRFTEVARYITETRDYAVIEALIMNNDLWESLSPSQQQVLTEAADQTGEWLNDQVMDNIEEMKQKMKTEHDAVYIQINREPFEELVREEIIPVLIDEGVLKQEYVDEILDL